MNYSGLSDVKSEESPHLGGNIRIGDPFTWCPRVWDYVFDRFAIRTAMDLGSGSGYAANYFSKKGIITIAVDGLKENIHSSVYPTIRQDLTEGSILTSVDFVHCQEVVEHINEKFLDNLLDSLLCGRIILMTHAVPEQGGHHHVNLQSQKYWIDHLSRRGCSFLDEDTKRIRMIASQEGATYMEQTGIIFCNNNVI